MKKKFENGINYLNKTVRRGYLRKDEENLVLTILMVTQLIQGRESLDGDHIPMWEKMTNAGVLTKEQQKNLKLGCTYLRKFGIDLLQNNLDYKEKEKILKKSSKFNFRFVDDYQLQRLERLFKDKKEITLHKDTFHDLIDVCLYVNCKGCKKDRTACKLRNFYEDYFIPPVNEEVSCNNCEYAFE